MWLIPGGKKRDTQTASNGNFWNTKGQCLPHPTSLFLAMSNFTMMVRLFPTGALNFFFSGTVK